jgi:hypothetical protein
VLFVMNGLARVRIRRAVGAGLGVTGVEGLRGGCVSGGSRRLSTLRYLRAVRSGWRGLLQ